LLRSYRGCLLNRTCRRICATTMSEPSAARLSLSDPEVIGRAGALDHTLRAWHAPDITRGTDRPDQCPFFKLI
jgi:hypothetical protein